LIVAKKNQTKDLLAGKSKPQGWKDQFETEPVAEEQKPSSKQAGVKYKRKTYLMSDDLIERIKAQAEKFGVGINETHRYLVSLALEQVEAGEHEPEIQEIKKRTLGV
jgi:hypothetical protein